MPPKGSKKGSKAKPVTAAEEPGADALPVENAVMPPKTTTVSSRARAKKSSNDSKFVEDTLGRFTQATVDPLKNTQATVDPLLGTLWPNFTDHTSTTEHILSIIMMINEKFRLGVPIFDILCKDDSNKFIIFFDKTIQLCDNISSLKSSVFYIQYLINAFRSLENTIVRSCALRYLSIPIWAALSDGRRIDILTDNPQLLPQWQYYIANKPLAALENGSRAKKAKQGEQQQQQAAAVREFREIDATWIPSLLKKLLHTIEHLPDDDSNSNINALVMYIAKLTEFFIDLLSQMPTRRFLNSLIQESHFVVRSKRSPLYLNKNEAVSPSNQALFVDLIGMLDECSHFQVNDQTGAPLSPQDVAEKTSARVKKLQQAAFTHHRETLKDLIFASSRDIGRIESLKRLLEYLRAEEIVNFAKYLGLLSDDHIVDVAQGDPTSDIVDFALDVIAAHVQARPSQLDDLNRLSLYPDERMLWGAGSSSSVASISSSSSSKEQNNSLALPKLNLQFLTLHDYLLRNFKLFRLESAYQIREDIADAVQRMQPKEGFRKGSINSTVFGGWARMALPANGVSIDHVARPLLGEAAPARVMCTVEVDLSRCSTDRSSGRAEWEALKEHDVVFLVSVQSPSAAALEQMAADGTASFTDKFGVRFVRGAEVRELHDEDNIVLTDPSNPDTRPRGPVGSKRRIKLILDPNQYYADTTSEGGAGMEPYVTANLVVRRKPKENNFKAVLQTIRDLMNSATTGQGLPRWLSDVFLGHGAADAAHYRNIPQQQSMVDYRDTFISADHLTASFPSSEVTFAGGVAGPPPYRLSFTTGPLGGETITAHPYSRPRRGPYAEDEVAPNSIAFTPMQVEAIRSGCSEGLSLIVGPPGTGKTDTAVQIILNLYHNYPTQKLLIVTHSNAALNDLFEKIIARDVDPRHMLRLGSSERLVGARGAAANKVAREEFSKEGRVNWSLARRLQLLSQVQHLARSVGVTTDVGYTCETAEYFLSEHIQPRISRFERSLLQASQEKVKSVAEIFPFNDYFSDTPQPVFGDASFDADCVAALECVAYIRALFAELADYKAFELLRTRQRRAEYLLTKQARIVAMTCTHAAITRRRLVDLGFQYDSVIIEESGQILEVETLIPMLLQGASTLTGGCRLRRVCLLGDHMQLPPVVQSRALQHYSRFDQSMFSRLIALGAPVVTLDLQGRAREELAALYAWRYDSGKGPLGSMDCIRSSAIYSGANPGFVHPFQVIDVPPFEGRGETCPTPHFYQNLGEAEFVVATYQYMRLVGYPADKISILTTYNGQKHLIRDVLAHRCADVKLFGRPHSVTTVDKYQGQQNDYILLSLVRTESIGHLADVRRLVVAMSRARLGLYVFCRQRLFESSLELYPAFRQLLARPTQLLLLGGESYNDDDMAVAPSTRPAAQVVEQSCVFPVEDCTAMGVLVYSLLRGGAD